MKKSNIDLPMLLLSVIVILIFTIGIFGSVREMTVINSESKSFDIYNHRIQEWISPDGVHYWYAEDGYMAPRIDNEGYYVIEK